MNTTSRWTRRNLVALAAVASGVAGCPIVVSAAPVAVSGRACTITGTLRGDVLWGTAGDDVICGLDGDDRLNGLGGDDVLFGGRGDDVLAGGDGNDLLRGDRGDDVMQGGAGNDGLRGGPGADTVQGGAGTDRLRGSAGGDELSGGSGHDVVIYMPRVAALRLSIGDGANDGGRGEGDDIAADVEDVRGGMGNDTIIGSNAGNRLFGLGGNDRLVGGRGNDALSGGKGRDVLDGVDGAGLVDNLFCGDGAGDRALADMGDQIGADCEDVVQNDPPTGISLAQAQVGENEPVNTLVGTLSATDPDHRDHHSFTLVAGAANNGLFRISGNQLRTDAVFDFESKSSYTVRVRAADDEGAAFAQPLTVTVIDGQEPPVAIDDTADADEDTVLELPLTGAAANSPAANDTDPDSDPLTVTAVSGVTGGTVKIAGGLIEFDPATNLCGPAAGGFSYDVADGHGGRDTGAVTVDIGCVDDVPTAVDDIATLAEDASATGIDVLGNDVDVDGDPITIDTITQPDHGTVRLAANAVSYHPAPEYCNSEPGGSSDTFSYAINGGDSATVAVTVSCVDDLPMAVGDIATIAEDDPPTAIPVLDNDSDVEKDPITITATSDPDHGTTAITGTGAGLTYRPDADHCNDPPGTSPDTFSYTIDGGDTATVAVTVTCVNDAPLAVDDAATLVEDDPATTLDVLANDTDVDGGLNVVASATQPDHGTAVITNGGANLTYLPDPNYCNSQAGGAPDAFTYSLNGGSTATVSVTVTCVAEDPVAVDDSVTISEDDPATTIDVLANDLDGDSVGITIDAVAQPANGTVVITNDGDGATYRPNPNYCNNPPGTTLDTFTYTIIPAGSTATVTVTVSCVDDAPVAVDDTATVTEDAAATAVLVLTNDSDVDGGPKTLASVTEPANGTATITGGGTRLTYRPNSNYCGTDSFTYTLNGGSTATVSVTVICVNDAPAITLSGSTPTFTENGPAVTVDGGLTVIDVDDTALVSGTVSITVGAVAGDTLTFTPAGGISDTNPAPAVVDLSGMTTVANWQSVLRSVQFSTASDTPTGAARTVSFTLDDGDVASNTATKQVTVVPVNDAPVLTQPDTATLGFTEGAPATVITPNITTSDVDNVNVVAATIDLGTGYVSGQDVLSLGTNPQHNITAAFDPATGTLTLSGTSTVANYQTALRDVRFVNSSQAPTAGTRTISIQVDDGPGPNDLSNLVTRAVTVTPVNDAPDAVNDSFTGANGALANTRLAVGTTTTGPHLATAGGVLSNDSDVDTQSGLTAGPATSSSGNCTGCNNVTLNSDGTFIYDPPAGFTGTDTFTYTLDDNDPQAPANQTDTATVTIEVVGPVVWYVDIDAVAPPAGQGGRSHSPFNSLAPLTTGGAADALDGAGDIIFLGVDTAPSNGWYEGGIVLEPNQRLWGEPFGLTVDPNGPRPVTTLVAATPTTPASGNPTVLNITFAGVGIELANGVDIQRVNAGTRGLGDNIGIAGTAITTATIGPNQLIGGNPTGFSLTGAAGGDISVGADITGLSGSAVDVRNRTSGTVTFSGSVTASRDNSGVNLINNAGATINFTGPINLAGNDPVGTFHASGGGTITATNTTSQITGFTAIGIKLSDIAIGAAGITFDTVTSLGPAGLGIEVINVAGPGGLTVNGGAITATSRALYVDTNSANVTIGATLTTSGTSARAVDVMNLHGGTVDINGLVTDNAGGINLDNNSTGVVRFDGGLAVSTTTRTAFNATGGGTFAITDPNGATAPNNTLSSTTGIALNVANTTIGADGLTFQSISAGTSTSGPSNGIVMNNTGSQGGLTVTGNSAGLCGGDVKPTVQAAVPADCGGGHIRNTVGTDGTTGGTGILLTNTGSVSLTRMRLSGHANYAIRGSNVNGFTFSNSLIDGTNGTSGDGSLFEGGIYFTGLTGSAAVTNSSISGGHLNNVSVVNTGGTLNRLTFSEVQIGANSTTEGADGLFVQADNSVSGLATDFRVTVQDSKFTSSRRDLFQLSVRHTTNSDLQFTGNMLSNNHPNIVSGRGGFTISSSLSSPNLTFNVSDNTFRDSLGAAVSIGKGFNSVGGTWNGTISGNTIGVTGVNASGSAQDSGIVVDLLGAGTFNATITNNVVRQYSNNGILVQSSGGPATVGGLMNAVVQGNTVAEPSSSARTGGFNGIRVVTGTSSADAPTRNCISVGGTAAAEKNTISGTGTGGATDLRLFQRFTTVLGIPGYTGAAEDNAAMDSFLAGRNTVTTVNSTNNTATGGPGFSGTCPS